MISKVRNKQKRYPQKQQNRHRMTSNKMTKIMTNRKEEKAIDTAQDNSNGKVKGGSDQFNNYEIDLIT